MSPRSTCILLPLLAASCAAQPQGKSVPLPPTGMWVTGYYPSWTAAQMPVSAIDFGPLTDIVCFALEPNTDGTLNTAQGGMTDALAGQVEEAAHAANRKALICVGGAGSGPNYEGAISDANRAKFAQAIADWVATHHYDGADIDMEPVQPSDIPNFQAFVKELHADLKVKDSNLLLTAAAGGDEAAVYPAIQDDFDRINIMTYDYSGPWEGWQTWYNAPLYNDGRTFSNGKPLPCVDSTLTDWISAGVNRAKIGIGAPFYGDDWAGADGPNQPIQGVKDSQIDYSDIVARYDTKKDYHWDQKVRCSYLSVDAPSKHFISFDDPLMIEDKVRYLKAKRLGGIIIWDLATDYIPANPPGKQQPLLSALDQAARAKS